MTQSNSPILDGFYSANRDVPFVQRPSNNSMGKWILLVLCILVAPALYAADVPLDRGRPASVTFTTKGQAVWIVVAATASDTWRRPLPANAGKWVVKADAQWKPCDQSDVLVQPGTALDFSWLVEPGPTGKHERWSPNPGQPVKVVGGLNMIAAWKRRLTEDAANLFAQGSSDPNHASETEIKELHAKIGPLTVEADFLEPVSCFVFG